MESIEYSDDFKKSKILYKFISFKKDYCLDILKFNKIYFSTKQQLNDPFDLTTFNYFIDIYDQNFKFNIFDSILNETGIFSMTLDPLNPLMWAHYSEAFTGFCLGLNKNKILGYLNRKKNMGVLEVKYLKENPKLKINTTRNKKVFI